MVVPCRLISLLMPLAPIIPKKPILKVSVDLSKFACIKGIYGEFSAAPIISHNKIIN
jgi:hypothetical protein